MGVLRQSKGTGINLDWTNTGAWALGVVPSGTDWFQIMPGDTVTISTDVAIAPAQDMIVGLAAASSGSETPQATLIVNGTLDMTNDPNNDFELRGNGVIQVGPTGKIILPNAFALQGGDLLLFNPNIAMWPNTNQAGSSLGLDVETVIDFPSRTFTLRNPHYIGLTFYVEDGAFNYGPNGQVGGTYGTNGQWLNEQFDTIPQLTVGQKPFLNTTANNFCPVLSIKQQTIYTNFIAFDDATNANIASVSFGTTYNSQAGGEGITGCFFPMAVPLFNGKPFDIAGAPITNPATQTPVAASIYSVGQEDGVFQVIVQLPAAITDFTGLSIQTFADDGNGNWVIQNFVYQPGSGAVSSGGGSGQGLCIGGLG